MSDVVGGAAAATGVPTTPTSSRPMTSTGNTPLAKRAATLTVVSSSNVAGPVMSADDATAFYVCNALQGGSNG